MFRVKRKSALSNIITNYFGTDPFSQEKQKPRLHLPSGKPIGRPQPPTAAAAATSNSSSSSTFAKRFLVKPLNLRLGPPIKILPTLNRNRPQQQPQQQQQQQQQQPKQQQPQQRPPQQTEDVYRASVPAPLLASGFNEHEERGRVPAPLLARNDGSTAKRPDGESETMVKGSQTFSQLVSNSLVSTTLSLPVRNFSDIFGEGLHIFIF